MDPLLAQITLTAANYAPKGWATCDGQLMNINSNPALFAVIGTSFGGDGRINFALPDLRGRVAIGSGNGPGLTPRVIGAKGGVESVALTVNQIPPHTHQVYPNFSATAGQSNPANNFPANIGEPNKVYGSSADGNMGASTVSNSGSGQAHENMQPWLCLNYIIATQGVFPMRHQ
jgi:microcystin-dependent protein